MSLAVRAVAEIVEDIRDRSGLKHEWLQIDEDVRAEIMAAWAAIIDRTYAGTNLRVNAATVVAPFLRADVREDELTPPATPSAIAAHDFVIEEANHVGALIFYKVTCGRCGARVHEATRAPKEHAARHICGFDADGTPSRELTRAALQHCPRCSRRLGSTHDPSLRCVGCGWPT